MFETKVRELDQPDPKMIEGQCDHCGREDTLVRENFWPATQVDPESADGYCTACKEPWEY